MDFGNSRYTNEMGIWIALLKLHLDEAKLGKKESLAWIFSKKTEEDIEIICDIVNLELGYVRRKIRERLRMERAKRKLKEHKKRDMIIIISKETKI